MRHTVFTPSQSNKLDGFLICKPARTCNSQAWPVGGVLAPGMGMGAHNCPLSRRSHRGSASTSTCASSIGWGGNPRSIVEHAAFPRPTAIGTHRNLSTSRNTANYDQCARNYEHVENRFNFIFLLIIHLHWRWWGFPCNWVVISFQPTHVNPSMNVRHFRW